MNAPGENNNLWIWMQAAAGRMHRCICGSNHFIFIIIKARIPELHNQLLHKKANFKG